MKDFPFTTLQLDWIKLLETTEKTQKVGYLRVGDSYCCLGLAAEFVLKLKPELLEDSEATYIFDEGISGLTHNSIEKLGLRGSLGDAAGFKFQSLASLNDSGSTFNYIAERLRGMPGIYFTNLEGRTNA